MNGIELVFGCGEDKVCFPNYSTAPAKDKSLYIALALIEKGGLDDEDITEDKIADGTTPANDVIEAVRKLQKLGKAVFFPLGHMSGSKPKPTEIVDNTVYGLRIDAKPTGDVTNTFTINYEYSHATQNVRFFNHLRRNITKYDAILWTDVNLTIIEGYQIDFLNVGTDVTGNAGEKINGGFDMRYLGDGEPIPYPYGNKGDLEGFTTLKLAPPVAVAAADSTIALSSCKGACSRYNATYETGGFDGTITFQLDEDPEVTPCVTWEIFKNCGKATVDTTVSINQAGVVTFTDFVTAGINQYTVLAYTDTCVVGEACFEIVATVQA